MKFFRGLFLTLTCLAGGLAVGTYLADANVMDNQLLILISGITAGVCCLLTIIFVVVVARIEKSRLNLKVSLQKKDIILQAGVEYVVKKHGTVRPGEYSVLATDENNKSFTVRVNDYVKEYTHNTTLILSAGDHISARSCNIILR